MLKRAIMLFVVTLGLAAPVLASRGVVPYQGTLKKAGQPYTGSAEMKFAIVDQGSVLWSNDPIDQRSGQPRRSVTIEATRGGFDVSLGAPPMLPLDTDLLVEHPDAALRVWVSTGGIFEQLSDQQLSNQSVTAPTATAAGGSPSAVWHLKGNRGTDPGTDFLGTTDDAPLILRTNDRPVMTLGSGGPVEVHTALFVHDSATVDKNLHVGGDLSAAGGVSLGGSVTFAGDATIDGNLTVEKHTEIKQDLHVTGGITSDGEATAKCVTILGGCDLSEPFAINSEIPSSLEPGMVVSIDPNHPGALILAGTPYDTKVAGVVSGANGIQPGMVMTQVGTPALDGVHNVALSGRVYVYATTISGPIRPGDLLTTSAVRGYAMKATDSNRTRGAVIGKAMSSLASGRGYVLLLVQPQ